MEDLGDRLLLDELGPETVSELYGRALDTLSQVQKVDPSPLPAYSREVLGEELARFPEWFCEALLGRPLGDARALFEAFSGQLLASAAEQPVVFVHRDFHSRNLLLCADDDLGIIDFQDAVAGPLCYDLVSLLKDCYIRWPREQVLEWVESYRARACPAVEAAIFVRWFDWLGLQRHVKVLGNFARLAVRDGRDGYLADLPLVLDYIREVLALYPEHHAFADWFASELEPLIAAQPWSRQP